MIATIYFVSPYFVTFVSANLLKAIINCTYGSFNSLINICDHHKYKLKSRRNSKIMKIRKFCVISAFEVFAISNSARSGRYKM